MLLRSEAEIAWQDPSAHSARQPTPRAFKNWLAAAAVVSSGTQKSGALSRPEGTGSMDRLGRGLSVRILLIGKMLAGGMLVGLCWLEGQLWKVR